MAGLLAGREASDGGFRGQGGGVEDGAPLQGA